MERRLNVLDWIAITLATIGALNWLLIGLFGPDANLVQAIFPGEELEGLRRIIYTLVGLSGLYLPYLAYRLSRPYRAPERTVP